MMTHGKNIIPSHRPFEAIVVGASAGGVDAMLYIFKGLPAHYPLPIIALLHIQETRESRLADLFEHHVNLKVKEAADKESLTPGTLYFAPASYHLSIERSREFSLSCEEPLNFSRPSIDILMESAADTYGKALVGILLTGANPDGAAGMRSIKYSGGLSIVQDPAEAEVNYMPTAAINLETPDMILRLQDINQLLISLGEQHAH